MSDFFSKTLSDTFISVLVLWKGARISKETVQKNSSF